jgi:monoamine oxidase
MAAIRRSATSTSEKLPTGPVEPFSMRRFGKSGMEMGSSRSHLRRVDGDARIASRSVTSTPVGCPDQEVRSWTAAKEAVLTRYCTGPRAARLSRVGEEEAASIVLADLERLFPEVDPRRSLLAYRRIDWTTDPFVRG